MALKIRFTLVNLNVVGAVLCVTCCFIFFVAIFLNIRVIVMANVATGSSLTRQLSLTNDYFLRRAESS